MSWASEYYKLRNSGRDETQQKTSTTGKKKKKSSTSGKTLAGEYLEKKGNTQKKSWAEEYQEHRQQRFAELEQLRQKGSLDHGRKVAASEYKVSGKDTDESKKEKDGRKWFQKGLFEDGYDFGDISKTILGTAADVGEDALTGLIGMGEKAVDALAMIAPYVTQGQYNAQFYDPKTRKVVDEMTEDAKGEMSKFVAKDLYDEQKVAQKILSSVPGAANMALKSGLPTTEEDWEIYRQTQQEAEKYIQDRMELESILGEKSDALVQSAGQLAGQYGLQAVGVPWWLTAGATSFGAEAEQALKEGATHAEATGSALISAGAEIVSEKLFGGDIFTKGGSDLVTDYLARAVSDKAARTLLKLGYDMAGEGAEEVFSEFMGNLGSALYKEESVGELLFNEEALDAYLESFVGGGVLGGVMGGINAAQSKAQGVDYTSGLTKNEEAVVQKVYEDRIAEQEKNGKKLSEREKKKLYDKVLSDMDKGYISTDTIEEVLGGDSYKTYRETADSYSEMETEYKTLMGMKRGEMTGEQQAREAELKQRLEEMRKAGTVDQSRTAMRDSVMGLVSGDRLAESYNEQARRGRKFTADLSKYSEKQRAAVQRAIDSGVLNDTNRTHEFVDTIARIEEDKGLPFDFTNNERLRQSGFAVEGRQVNGYVTSSGVTLNVDSPMVWQRTVGHEVTHVLKGTDMYDAFRERVFKYAEARGELESRRVALTELYKDVQDADIDDELIADLVGEYLFHDSDFVSRLSTENRTLFEKIYDEIKYLLRVVTAGSKEARELERIKKDFEKAYKAEGKGVGETKYSLEMVDPIQPQNGGWKRGAVTDEVRAAHPTLYAVDETATEERNPTQVKNTVGSYRKVFNLLQKEGFTGSILDASSGLGLGTKAGIEEYGFDVEDIEPYPDKDYSPKYTDYSSLEKQYDVIISNAVLNVVPQDQRDALVVKMGELLAPGGRMFINVRGKDVLNSSGKIAIDEANMEYFIPRTAKTGSYQKGFTKSELVAYLQDALGDGYTVTPTSMFGAVSAIVQKRSGDVKYSLSDSQGQEPSQVGLAPTFYSNLAKVVEGVKQEKIGASSLIPMLRGRGVKAEEIKWSGLEEWLEGKKSVTRAELLEFLQGSQLQIEEEVLDNETVTDYMNLETGEVYLSEDEMLSAAYDIATEKGFSEDDVRSDFVGGNWHFYAYKDGVETELLTVQTSTDNINPTRWGDYKIEGGSRYREFVFTLPSSYHTNPAMETHWGDRTGVLAHARVQDFDTPDGKMLFIEEIQSDWHNEGHNKGYKPKDIDRKVSDLKKRRNDVKDALYAELFELGKNQGIGKPDVFAKALLDDPRLCEVFADSGYYSPEISERLKEYHKLDREWRSAFATKLSGVPDAPFKGNYHEYVLKRLIREAAEKGYTSIGWTTADMQSERWSDEYAEGYRIEYDQDIPKFLNKYGKKWGAKVGKTKLGDTYTDDFSSYDPYDEYDAQALALIYLGLGDQVYNDDSHILTEVSRNHNGDNERSLLVHVEDTRSGEQWWVPSESLVSAQKKVTLGGTEVWTMPITPAMRESVLHEGQPMYSLSEEGATDTHGTPMSDLRFVEEIAPVAGESQSEVAPVREDAIPFLDEESAVAGEPVPPEVTADEPDAVPPATDIQSIDDSDAPPEAEAPYPETDPVTVDDPFEKRDWFMVGKRSVKAFMHTNPEVTPFFQREAEVMLGELRASEKGRRLYDDVLYYDTRGEQGWSGQKRVTSDDIAYLIDAGGMRYEDIERGLNAIIQGGGAENNAASKRIEFILSDRLRKGYTDFRTGAVVPPDPEYIKVLNGMQTTASTEESIASLMDSAESYFPPEDKITNTAAPEDFDAPVVKTPGTPVDQVAPVAPNPPATSQPVTPPGSNPSFVPPNAPYAPGGNQPPVNNTQPRSGYYTKKPFDAFAWVKEHIMDNGMVFEDLSYETGNRELQAKWNFTRNSQARAQHLIGKGVPGVRSLTSVFDEVKASGKMADFEKYLAHKHNVDRMSLDARGFGEDKPVMGFAVTSAMSQREVDAYEKANPEFIEWADHIYAFNDYLLDLQVSSGFMTQDAADLCRQMYPHYVPIHRVKFDGLLPDLPNDPSAVRVGNPVKKAVGGNGEFASFFEAMAERAVLTYSAIARNNFGIELKNTLGTVTGQSRFNPADALDSIYNFGYAQPGATTGSSPTYTVFENGHGVTFAITPEMFEALKPRSEILEYRVPFVNGLNEIFRKLTTEYNPVFSLTNPIKDIQDIILNSQHPASTYANLPRSIWQQMSDGRYYQEYLANGGEGNTYFDGREGSFKRKGMIRKIVGFPLDAISWLNGHIEMTPRLAEYIASREAGRSIEQSMLDAARVTTNFAAGGDVTKFANRNGCTFLNASVQGAIQQGRNIRDAHHKGALGYAGLLTRFALAGLPAVLLNNLLWDDDEEYENLADYVKQDFYIVGKYDDGKFIRIPKGRAVAVIQDGIQQVMNAATGDDEVDLLSFLKLVGANLAPNNPFTNNLIAPFVQIANNRTWYDEELIPSRLQDLPAAEQFDEKTDDISRLVGEKTGISPYQINYLLNQYTGGAGDFILPMITPRAESGDDSVLGKALAPFRDKFTTDSVINSQVVTDFRDLQDQLKASANSKNATEVDKFRSMYVESISFELNDLYAKKREIQSSDLPDSRKYEMTREIQADIVSRMQEAIDSYEDVHVDGKYATVSDKRYNFDTEKDTWYEIKKFNKDGSENYHYQQEQTVTKAFSISPSEYWNNREAYDDAYYYATSYGKNITHTVKKVFGAPSYASWKKGMSGLKADYDDEGKAISGSKKDKVIDFVNGMDAEYGERIIYYKSEYPKDHTYNLDIIDYLNERNDISHQDMRIILTELGFTVDDEGYIYWE